MTSNSNAVKTSVFYWVRVKKEMELKGFWSEKGPKYDIYMVYASPGHIMAQLFNSLRKTFYEDTYRDYRISPG